MRASRTHIKCFVALLLGVAGVTGCLAPKSLSVLLGPASHIQFSTPSRLLHSDTTPDQAPREQLSQTYGKLPLSFEANRGQTDAQVRFLSRSHRQTLFLTSTEAVLVFTKPSPTATDQPETRGQAAGTMLRMAFAGSNPQVRVTGLEELPGKANYIIGNDPTKWRTNVPTYGKVHYQDLYPGIDLIYYSTQRQLEYDLVVGPGADPHKIVLAFQGADHLAIDTHGDLVVHTPDGAILQRRPVAYQEIDGVRLDITCIYVLKETGQVSLQVAAYDATSPLVIDPALSYSTYLGGSDNDFAGSIAVDSAGNAYVTGFTTSTNFPTTPGAFQPTFGGSSDVFVTKLNPTGSALVYSTYLGGTGDDDARSIAVDSAGNAYVTGFTTSTNFPTTPGAFQLTLGGSFDVFVTKLNPTGSALVYSTYLGGTGDDDSGGIAVDSAGNAYVAGSTTSTNFPTISGAFQPTFGGSSDAFVTKLNPTGSALVYSTYLGGSGSEGAVPDGRTIAVDSAGNAYVTGFTTSTNFPTTPGAFQPTFGGSSDGFVTKLNPTGSALAYSTYLGGTGDETCDAIAVDSAGNAYVTGQTGSTDFPTTSGAFQPTLSGSNDAFIARISPADIVATDSATAQEGQIVTASTAPTMAGEAGVSVTLTNTPDGGGPATVTVRTYSANPTAVNIFDAGGGFVDVHIKGADPTDLATARFYYPSTVPEATEAGLQLLYFTGTAWALVLSSVGLPPVNDTTDNQDGTVSSGRFLVTFDSTSTPKITQLTGTVFTMTTPGGTPVAWGNNQVGQLGNGTFTTSNTPTHVSTLTHVSAISGGAGHSVAVKADSTAWAWGSNFRGQLGNGTTTTSNVPVAVSGLSQVRAVSAGGAHSLAVKTDGTVWSWGDNTTGQLGLGTTGGTQLVPVHLTTLTGITAVSAGAGHSVALKNDGSVWAWGDNRVGELGNGTVGGVNPTPAHVPGLTGVTAIATFGAHTLALKTDGTVWAWGDNQSGQLGVGTIGGNSPTPVQVSGLTGIIAITAGAAHSVALGTDGLIRACGNNSSGQLGDGTFTTRSTPTLVQGLIQVTHIGAGGAHSLALKADGTAWAWGDNRTGQLGTGNFTTSRRPVQVTGISGGLLIAGGGAYSLAIVTP